MARAYEILQLVPSGPIATYARVGPYGSELVPVVCWARCKVREDDGTTREEVVGMVAVIGSVIPAPSIVEFVGYDVR